MNVSLTPDLERYVAKKLESGHYRSASEVVREGLRLLAERDRLLDARFYKALREGPPEFEEPWPDELGDELEPDPKLDERIRRKLRRQRPAREAGRGALPPCPRGAG